MKRRATLAALLAGTATLSGCLGRVDIGLFEDEIPLSVSNHTDEEFEALVTVEDGSEVIHSEEYWLPAGEEERTEDALQGGETYAFFVMTPTDDLLEQRNVPSDAEEFLIEVKNEEISLDV